MTPGNDGLDLGALVRLSELRADPDIARIFPGQHSLTWEIRQHRAEYVAGGALFALAGRLLVNPTAFKKIALAIGARKVADTENNKAA
jgi:catalase (peroxidase I)